MKRLSLCLLATLVAPSVWAADSGIVQSPAYKECIALSASNPAQALAKADEWLKIDAGIAAYHCRAMALYGLKRFPEAGDALNAVRSQIAPEDIELRTFVTKQSVAAWVAASRADAALGVLDSQLSEMDKATGNNVLTAKLTAELLLERAKLNLTYGKAKAAAQDLDRAITLTPLNAALLAERATAFEMLGDLPLARADAQAALTLKPDNAKAKALLARIDGK